MCVVWGCIRIAGLLMVQHPSDSIFSTAQQTRILTCLSAASPHRTPSREYAKLLAAAFEKRTDLRVTICRALRRLCTQNRAVLAAAGQAVGFADPYGSTEEEEAAAGGQEEQAHGDIPADYTPDMALE